MAVTYAARGDEFGASRPRVWADVPMDNDLGRTFDVHADGTRIAVLKSDDSTRQDVRDTAVLIFNFTGTLRSRVH